MRSPTVGGVATIAAKELTELLRDRRLHALGLLVLLLMLAALALGWQQMRRTEAERAEARSKTYEQWLKQGDRNPHSAAHFGQYAFKPEGALGFIDPGIGAFVGTSVWMEAHKQNDFRFRPARDATVLRRFGDLSIAFVWQVLSPLLIILLAFAAFSGERERGTLRQLLSVGVRPSQLLLGKWLAVAGLAGLLLLPPLLVGAAAVVIGEEHAAEVPGALARLGLMGLGYAIYLGGFGMLALGVSAASGSSRTALIALLAFWIVNSFVAPRVMIDLATRLAPTPSAVVFQKTLGDARRANFGHDETHPAYLAFKERMFQRYGVKSEAEMPVNFKALALREDDEGGYRIFDENYARLWGIHAAQERIRVMAGLLFPYAAMQPWSMAMAGTDIAQHNAFAAEAERYRRLLQNAMSEDMIRNRKNNSDDYLVGEDLWKSIPPFDYHAPPLGTVARQSVTSLLVLLGWVVLVTTFAVRSVRRLSPV